MINVISLSEAKEKFVFVYDCNKKEIRQCIVRIKRQINSL